MSQFLFHVYNDPGHGWVKVPKALLQELGIANKISKYSYEKGAFSYLEEDVDFSLFEEAFTAKTGRKPAYADHYANQDSRIRNYQHYTTPEQNL